ncbi:hypothetical protein Dimus_012206 [Dionaea muscipula]
MASKPSSSNSTQNQKLLILSILFLSLSLFLLLSATTLQPLTGGGHQSYSSTHKPPKWFIHISKQHDLIELLRRKKMMMRIGLVNMGLGHNYSEQLHGLADVVAVKFDGVSRAVEWPELFPEWIDEAAVTTHRKPPKCPDIPMPAWNKNYQGLDVVVARLPCGIRDVFRLQVNLVVANLVVASSKLGGGGGGGPGGAVAGGYVVFVGRCEPMWEIFRCDDLLWHEVGKYWVYRPNVSKLKEKVLMPVGTCELAPPPPQLISNNNIDSDHSCNSSESSAGMMMSNKVQDDDEHRREAYATMLHSSEEYVCGAIALAQSLLGTNTSKDLILLADPFISRRSIRGLSAAGWKIKRIERIRSPHAKQGAYNEWNYSKLRVWQLTDYHKVIFIDSDFIVLGNIDHLFSYPQLSAAPNHMWIFNSGLMVIEPSQCVFNHLMSKRYTLRSYNGGDQGYINEVFTWWHRITTRLNYLKVYDHELAAAGRVVRVVPDDRYALHFLGLKPWVCYRDYDCNWDKLTTQVFASDHAHEKWWQVYQRMPKGLKGYCGLSKEMDDRLRKWREKARKDNLPDGHWRILVKDPRSWHH